MHKPNKIVENILKQADIIDLYKRVEELLEQRRAGIYVMPTADSSVWSCFFLKKTPVCLDIRVHEEDGSAFSVLDTHVGAELADSFNSVVRAAEKKETLAESIDASLALLCDVLAERDIAAAMLDSGDFEKEVFAEMERYNAQHRTLEDILQDRGSRHSTADGGLS